MVFCVCCHVPLVSIHSADNGLPGCSVSSFQCLQILWPECMNCVYVLFLCFKVWLPPDLATCCVTLQHAAKFPRIIKSSSFLVISIHWSQIVKRYSCGNNEEHGLPSNTLHLQPTVAKLSCSSMLSSMVVGSSVLQYLSQCHWQFEIRVELE